MPLPPTFVYPPTVTSHSPVNSKSQNQLCSSQQALGLKLPRPCEPKHPQSSPTMPECSGMQAMCPPDVKQSAQSQPAMASMSKSPEAKTPYLHDLFPPFVDLPLNGLDQKSSRVPELWKVKQEFLPTTPRASITRHTPIVKISCPPDRTGFIWLPESVLGWPSVPALLLVATIAWNC